MDVGEGKVTCCFDFLLAVAATCADRLCRSQLNVSNASVSSRQCCLGCRWTYSSKSIFVGCRKVCVWGGEGGCVQAHVHTHVSTTIMRAILVMFRSKLRLL